MLRRRFMMISGVGPTPPGPVYPTDGLVHEFTFDSSNLTDTGSSPVTPTGTNIVGYTTGIVGQCLNLDRTSGVACDIALPSNANNDCRTFSVWFKRGTGYATTTNFFVSRPSSNYYISVSSTQVRINQSSSVYSTYTGGVSTSNHDWHHLVVTLIQATSSASTCEVWLDGTKLTATRTNNHTTSNFQNNNGRYLGVVSTNSYNCGYYDQWRIYNRVLTDAEIAQLYNSGQGV